MNQKNIFVPTRGTDEWRQLLADPDKHWKVGASAQTLAESWETAAQNGSDWPATVSQALGTDSTLGKLELLAAFPEYKVALPGGSRPSQTDLLVIARSDAGELVVIAVEGKVAEPFGELVSDWRGDSSQGRVTRLAYLLETVGLRDDARLGAIRYQLLHRTASAVIVARRFNARHALMLVHSFHPEGLWLDDFQAFAAGYGADIAKNHVAPVAEVGAVSLHLGWVTDA